MLSTPIVTELESKRINHWKVAKTIFAELLKKLLIALIIK